MKKLETQRALYLKSVEAAGSIEVLEVVQRLENEKLELKKRECSKAFASAYIRTGSFTNPYIPIACTTDTVYCLEKNQAQAKKYFEERNPRMVVICEPHKNYCEASYRPESFFN